MAFKKEEVIIIKPREVFVGDEDAPVTLMEFGEYENEDCAKANAAVSYTHLTLPTNREV